MKKVFFTLKSEEEKDKERNRTLFERGRDLLVFEESVDNNVWNLDQLSGLSLFLFAKILCFFWQKGGQECFQL